MDVGERKNDETRCGQGWREGVMEDLTKAEEEVMEGGWREVQRWTEKEKGRG